MRNELRSAGLALVLCGLLPLTALSAEPGPEAVLAELPFLDAGESTAVMIDLAPQDSARELPLLLDTGASFSVMTPGMARSLGIAVRRHKSSPYRRATRLGRDLQFWVDTSRGDVAAATGWELGLLGANFLSEYVLEIDYPGRRVRFLDPRRYRVPEQGEGADETVVPLRLVGGRALVEIEVGSRPLRVLLDTGAPFGLLLGGPEAKRAGIVSHPAAGLSAQGVKGPIGIELGDAARIRVGGFELHDEPVAVAPRGLYQQATGSDSVIGHDLLARHVVRIDYPRRRLWLRRGQDRRPRLLGEDYARVRRSGALLEPADDGARVTCVLRGGRAARLGLAPGDRLASGATAESPDRLAALYEAVATAEAITVWRPAADGVWQEIVLRVPEAPAAGP